MEYLLSPLLIGIGQTAAVLLFFLYDEPDAFQARPARIGCTLGFYALLVLSQAQLHRFVAAGGLGSLPTLPFLLLSWCLYALFILLWSHAPWENCCFIAFVLLLADNCIWPLVSMLSRVVWGANYLEDLQHAACQLFNAEQMTTLVYK